MSLNITADKRKKKGSVPKTDTRPRERITRVVYLTTMDDILSVGNTPTFRNSIRAEFLDLRL